LGRQGLVPYLESDAFTAYECLSHVRGLAQTIRAWYLGHRRAGHHEAIIDGNPDYLAWIAKETETASEQAHRPAT
jgi:hypothetical protein